MSDGAPSSTSIDVPPVVRVVYLLAVAVALFVLRTPLAVGSLAALQLVLWPAVGLPIAGLLRQFRKLSFFAVAILATYALFGDARDASQAWTVGPVTLDLRSAGIGLLMVLRVVGVVLASQIARAGDPRALTAGMRGLGLPESAAIGLDAVLALLGEAGGRGGGRGGGGGGGGRGGGGGGGGGGRGQEGEAEGDAARGWQAMAKWASHLRRGDLRPLVRRLDASVERARLHVGDQASGGSDLPVIVGIAVTMLGFKALKILPGLPYAPGHRLVIFLPLYVVAAVRTNGRFGASGVGLAMGFASFLMGDGRYGIFEVLKHLAPGLICDLALPLFRSAPRGVVFWGVFGALAGATRFATEFAVISLAQPPAVAYALLAPGLASNLFFGFLSGYVTRHVLAAVTEVDHNIPTADADTRIEEESDGRSDHRGRSHSHPVEADEGVAGQSRRRRDDR